MLLGRSWLVVIFNRLVFFVVRLLGWRVVLWGICYFGLLGLFLVRCFDLNVFLFKMGFLLWCLFGWLLCLLWRSHWSSRLHVHALSLLLFDLPVCLECRDVFSFVNGVADLLGSLCQGVVVGPAV